MNTFKTLYLSKPINLKELSIIENAISCKTSLNTSQMPAIKVYADDKNLIDDDIYWLGIAGFEVLKVA